MTLDLKLATLGGSRVYKEAFDAKFGVVKRAVTGAMKDAGDFAKQEGRKSIAAAGFKRKWQNALRAEVFPKKKASVNAAAYVYHKIGYAGVFEYGATIKGKPLLWVPTKNSPARIGRSKVTPRKFHSQIARLRSAKGTKRPMLIAQYRRGRGRRKKGAVTPHVPVFVGVPSVKIPEKFKIRKAVERAASRLVKFYFANLKDN